MYGLPRKFNVAFDNGGAISVVADTNDIGFMAVRVKEDVGRRTRSRRASIFASCSAESPGTSSSRATADCCCARTRQWPSLRQ